MVAVLALGTAAIATYSKNSANQTEVLTTVLSLRSTMVAAIENPQAWKSTLAADSSLACVKDFSKCEVGEKSLKLYDEKGNLFYDGTSEKRGFTTKGQSCETYSGQTTTDCVYHYDLTWEPMCEAEAGQKKCKDSDNLVKVGAKLQVAATVPQGSQISKDSYSVTVTKGVAQNSIEKNCIAVAGKFDPVTKICTAPVASSTRCKEGTVVTSIQPDGSLTCSAPFAEACSDSEILIGRDASGMPKCQSVKSRKIAKADDDKKAIDAFECKSFVSLPLTDPLEIPARSYRDGVCYSVKLFDAVPNGPSKNTIGMDKDILSRNHDIASWDYSKIHNPYIMGKALIKILTHDNRFVKLSGAAKKVAPITIDNFAVVGTFPDTEKEKPSIDYYKSYGTADSAINEYGSIGFKDQLLDLQAFGAAGTSTIEALDITSNVKPFVLYDLDIRVLDCGGVREASEIYLLFQ